VVPSNTVSPTTTSRQGRTRLASRALNALDTASATAFTAKITEYDVVE
jgi:hypothetical protein